jgi:hypothetical protein
MSELPNELVEIAKNVTVEKRSEVQNVLNSVFSGVSKMREQLDLVEVTSQDDKVNMKLANTIRLGVRQVRLDAERTFDEKRSEVQNQMLSFKTEDQLWLKAKQTMQILTKEIESNAKWKEETKIRFDLEAKELETQQRIIEVSKFDSEINRIEFEKMSSDSFDIFLSGIEAKFIKIIEEEQRIEFERLAKIKADEDERLRINSENESLRKEAEEKEKQIAKERAVANAILAEEKAKSELATKKAELLAKQETDKLNAILKAEKDLREKLQMEADKIKQEAEEKEKALKDAELKDQKAPKKIKLTKWVNDFYIVIPSGMDQDETVKDILQKFESFKSWAKNEIKKL